MKLLMFQNKIVLFPVLGGLERGFYRLEPRGQTGYLRQKEKCRLRLHRRSYIKKLNILNSSKCLRNTRLL